MDKNKEDNKIWLPRPHALIDVEIIHDILNKVDQTAFVVSDYGDIVFANTTFLEHYGLERSQVEWKKVYDESLGISDRQHFEELMKRTLENGGILKFDREAERDGQRYYYEVSITSFEREGHIGFLFLSKDITELRKSRLQTEQLYSMLKKIIDNLPVYLFVKDVDDDLRYIIWNRAFAEYSKIPAEKVIGRTDFEVFPEYVDAKQFRDDDLKVVETGEMASKHETYRAADGTTRVVQTYKTLVRRQGKGPLLVGISLDITDIEGIEYELVAARMKAEESDRLKTRFLANMSHEIRTPLNAIVGFAQMLPEADDDEMRQKFVNIINDNCDLLLRLINDILDLSKIEAGIIDYNRMPMNLMDVFRNLHITYKSKINPDVKLIFDNAGETDKLIVNEDRNRLLQVMDNLLSNAVKFTSEGEIHYGYKLKDDGIEMYVSDTGKGIPAEKQAQIFQRFVKLDNFTQGTGLGLPICKLIVDTLGGEISLESEEGRGSKFSFTIPCKDGLLPKKPESNAKVVAPPPKERKDRTILVAEDVESNYLIVETMIKGRYNVVRAKDGVSTVALAKEIHPDLIIMDIKMPHLNGLDATREIRKFDKDVPIVAMTANAFNEDRVKALQAGMDDFLAKPIKRGAFESMLKTYLDD